MTHLEIRGCGFFIFGEARITGVAYGLYIIFYYNWDYRVPSSYPMDPLDFTALHDRALAYFDTGDYDQAIEDYNAALRIDPNFAYARENLEQARRLRGY
ncbi:MAG: tetratricopeptide repeat protein [Treponema sp.]|jgi:tetratricopeptide (TPR) repeat protein|nr:tetratricopeptide repeat protein [Treponema sp.]